MGLSKQEQAMLKRLQAKAEEPDPPAVGRTLSANIDLGDEKQVALAKKFGFLPADDDVDDEGEEGEGEGEGSEGDDKPRRRGYFQE